MIAQMGRAVCLIGIALVASPVAWAADGWTIERISRSSVPAAVLAESGRKAPNGLPDGRVAKLRGGDVVEAWYQEPTRRYGHAILGDGIEAGALAVKTAEGKTLTLRLPETEVFEDRTPRLADLDGDGKVEIIVIRASLTGGGSVAVYGLVDGRLAERATNGYIGRSNRWLNIAGIADFDGRPGLEIAHVRTPHIGGTLFFHSYNDGKMKQIAAIDGFSNHQIGAREMRLSAITDLDGDGRVELAVPSNDRATLRVIELADNGALERTAIALPARIDKAIVAKGRGPSTVLYLGLDDGRFYRLKQAEAN
ncbi:MAG: VCBS repeat-containing protein [Pseudomonadota bacterium]